MALHDYRSEEEVPVSVSVGCLTILESGGSTAVEVAVEPRPLGVHVRDEVRVVLHVDRTIEVDVAEQRVRDDHSGNDGPDIVMRAKLHPPRSRRVERDEDPLNDERRPEDRGGRSAAASRRSDFSRCQAALEHEEVVQGFAEAVLGIGELLPERWRERPDPARWTSGSGAASCGAARTRPR